jgi:hypothetical protein
LDAFSRTGNTHGQSETASNEPNNTAASAPTLSLPKASGAIRGIAEKFATNPVAGKQREAIERSIIAATQRYRHFEQLLGRKRDDITLPEIEALDAEGLEGLKYRNSEPEIAPRAVAYDNVEGLDAMTGGRLLNRNEAAEIMLSRQPAAAWRQQSS